MGERKTENNKFGLRNVDLIKLNSLNRMYRKAVVMDLTNIKMCRNKQFHCVLTMNWNIFCVISCLRANFNKLHLTHESNGQVSEKLFNTQKSKISLRENPAKEREKERKEYDC